MAVVSVHTLPPIVEFCDKANMHFIFSPIVSRCGMVVFFVGVCRRFILESRVFEERREVLRLSAAVASEGSHDHIWFVVFRRISIVTKSTYYIRHVHPSTSSVCRHVSAWVLLG
jgi:hypothetical protein